jgi:hypothetical protein
LEEIPDGVHATEKNQRAVIWLVNSLVSRNAKRRRLRRQPNTGYQLW